MTRIDDYRFGRVVVDGEEQTRDVIVLPERVLRDWWRADGHRLVLADPDAPGGVFTHWVAWGLDPGAEGLGEAQSVSREGRNGFGTTGYRGPCPPPGHGRHRYVFRLYALDTEPELAAGAAKTELERAIEGHVLTTAELVGTYER